MSLREDSSPEAYTTDEPFQVGQVTTIISICLDQLDQLFPLSLTDDQRVRILKYTFPPFALPSSSSSPPSSSSFPPSSSSSHHHLCHPTIIFVTTTSILVTVIQRDPTRATHRVIDDVRNKIESSEHLSSLKVIITIIIIIIIIIITTNSSLMP